MAAIILKVIEYKREKINGILMDSYKLKMKDGDRVYETLGFRHAFPLQLEPGNILENMRAMGKLSDEEFVKEWYEAIAIEKAIEERKKEASVTKKEEPIVKSAEMRKPVAEKPKPLAPQMQQLSLF